jgi:hypothetical protein
MPWCDGDGNGVRQREARWNRESATHNAGATLRYEFEHMVRIENGLLTLDSS